MIYTYDTETSYRDGVAWIWSWGLCDEHMRTVTGNGLTALRALTDLPDGSDVWVHNLSFDGEFVFWLLLEAGYKLVYGLTGFDRRHWVFEMVEDLSGILRVEIWTEGRKVTLRDSFRLFRCKLEQLPKLCGFDDVDQKLDMDYDEIREIDHVKTPAEDAYQRHDVTVLMRAVKWIKEIQPRGNTIGGVAMAELRTALGQRSPFKPLTIDQRRGLRSLYSGGVVKLREENAGRVLRVSGKVFDRNSMYSAEATHPLPVALRGLNTEPLPSDPDPDGARAYAVHVLAHDLQLRRDGFPLIVTPFTGNARTHIDAVDKWFYLEEWNTIREDYQIGGYEIVSTASFDQTAFAGKFVEKWYNVKCTSSGPMRTFSKYVLNNFTGKLAQNEQQEQMRRQLTPEGEYLYYRYNEHDLRVNKWLFMPATARITSRSRLALRDADRRCGGGLYNDTDSVITTGELPADMIDPVKLGAWDCEGVFDTACFIKPKSYYLTLGGSVVKQKHAGISLKAHTVDGRPICPETMVPGTVFITPQAKRVKGGVAILDVEKHL